MQIRSKENTINVKFADGQTKSFLRGVKLLDLPAFHVPDKMDKIVLGIVNYKLTSLQENIFEDCLVDWVELYSPEGVRAYRTTLSLILLRAVYELFPEKKLRIDHSLGNGLYCEWTNHEPVKKPVIKKIGKRMEDIIKADEAIETVQLYRPQAVDLLIQFGEDPDIFDANPEQTRFTFFKTGDLILPMGYPALASTGAIKAFDIIPYAQGMILTFPNDNDVFALPEQQDLKKLFRVFHEYGEWEKILGINRAADLNRAAADGSIFDLIKIAEGLHEKRIASIADMITRKKAARLALIAGPSSSGKTTFTKRLDIQLRVNGYHPLVMNMDNYFMDREKTPRNEKGKPDYESIHAIDIEKLNLHLNQLLEGKEVQIPYFDFTLGKQVPGSVVKVGQNQPILLEGIHALNSAFTCDQLPAQKMKIYISALTQTNIMDHLRVATSDVRKLRRIIRDHQFRGYSAIVTLERWPEVRHGEEINIFPFQEDADVIFNSSLIYELGVLRPLVLPLLFKVPMEQTVYSEAQRLIELLLYFLPLDQKHVPTNSILAEFIGNSSFYY